ncbi:RecQ family ATP-dependent DNA helicase [Sediminibacterium soli]|uniref:RecQ family ATP-dependent DNA helicase n=1 Tax=Sediminibacterium soli TaxID=2698829 RepID=UPI00137AC241|nr:ATP-dependent DNA helicase RecQ [Sediminibacterium soli]NCI45513.1 RecQ family ATP-dependent DNA helicase [Sediminibacterium soli]
MPSPLYILQTHWQHKAFRPMQEEIIGSVLAGRDTLALLPTGGGKSICFQVPALLMDGVCLVISPLIALMQDQVENLKKRNISAAALHSGMTVWEVKNTLAETAGGVYKFLYVSPERIESTVFREWLPAMDIGLIAVDEAHCISQWGYDFRPAYLRILSLRAELPDAGIIALTASATPQVQDDIVQQLRLKEASIFRQSFERPNLSYSVLRVDSKIHKTIDVLSNVPGSSIVYCGSRRQTKQLARTLNLHKIAADDYHAGLTAEERTAKQQAWISGHIRVMVCTNAFGMGIDKPDVRSVIHYDVPDCLENYYQEAGRAGRDGKKSFAALLYGPEDSQTLLALPDKKFPPIAVIRKVYQALADYLHIPVGNGEGLYYDFDLPVFVKNFQLDTLQVVNTLKVLEQEGHIGFSENIFLPSQVVFTADRETMDTFQTVHQALEPLIKCLLRTYEGILDNRLSVFERQMAKLCRLSVEEVTKGLQQLQAYGIIQYLPQKNTPQVHYLLNRAPAQYLHIDQDKYLQRKKMYAARLEKVVRYIDSTEGCRSRFIADYFGDTGTKDCGICDHCLAAKRKEIGKEEFDAIRKIIEASAGTSSSIDTLLPQLRQYSREKIWTVIGHLQDEKLIHIDDQGVIRK